MTTEEFLKDVCPNHTDKSKWNKSELLHILELHTEQLRKHAVSNSVCRTFMADGETTSATKCIFCGKEQWEH